MKSITTKKPVFFDVPYNNEKTNILDSINKKLIETESLRQTLIQLQTSSMPKKKPRFLLKLLNINRNRGRKVKQINVTNTNNANIKKLKKVKNNKDNLVNFTKPFILTKAISKIVNHNILKNRDDMYKKYDKLKDNIDKLSIRQKIRLLDTYNSINLNLNINNKNKLSDISNCNNQNNNSLKKNIKKVNIILNNESNSNMVNNSLKISNNKIMTTTTKNIKLITDKIIENIVEDDEDIECKILKYNDDKQLLSKKLLKYQKELGINKKLSSAIINKKNSKSINHLNIVLLKNNNANTENNINNKHNSIYSSNKLNNNSFKNESKIRFNIKSQDSVNSQKSSLLNNNNLKTIKAVNFNNRSSKLNDFYNTSSKDSFNINKKNTLKTISKNTVYNGNKWAKNNNINTTKNIKNVFLSSVSNLNLNEPNNSPKIHTINAVSGLNLFNSKKENKLIRIEPNIKSKQIYENIKVNIENTKLSPFQSLNSNLPNVLISNKTLKTLTNNLNKVTGNTITSSPNQSNNKATNNLMQLEGNILHISTLNTPRNNKDNILKQCLEAKDYNNESSNNIKLIHTVKNNINKKTLKYTFNRLGTKKIGKDQLYTNNNNCAANDNDKCSNNYNINLFSKDNKNKEKSNTIRLENCYQINKHNSFNINTINNSYNSLEKNINNLNKIKKTDNLLSSIDNNITKPEEENVIANSKSNNKLLDIYDNNLNIFSNNNFKTINSTNNNSKKLMYNNIISNNYNSNNNSSIKFTNKSKADKSNKIYSKINKYKILFDNFYMRNNHCLKKLDNLVLNQRDVKLVNTIVNNKSNYKEHKFLNTPCVDIQQKSENLIISEIEKYKDKQNNNNNNNNNDNRIAINENIDIIKSNDNYVNNNNNNNYNINNKKQSLSSCIDNVVNLSAKFNINNISKKSNKRSTVFKFTSLNANNFDSLRNKHSSSVDSINTNQNKTTKKTRKNKFKSKSNKKFNMLSNNERKFLNTIIKQKNLQKEEDFFYDNILNNKTNNISKAKYKFNINNNLLLTTNDFFNIKKSIVENSNRIFTSNNRKYSNKLKLDNTSLIKKQTSNITNKINCKTEYFKKKTGENIKNNKTKMSYKAYDTTYNNIYDSKSSKVKNNLLSNYNILNYGNKILDKKYEDDELLSDQIKYYLFKISKTYKKSHNFLKTLKNELLDTNLNNTNGKKYKRRDSIKEGELDSFKNIITNNPEIIKLARILEEKLRKFKDKNSFSLSCNKKKSTLSNNSSIFDKDDNDEIINNNNNNNNNNLVRNKSIINKINSVLSSNEFINMDNKSNYKQLSSKFIKTFNNDNNNNNNISSLSINYNSNSYNNNNVSSNKYSNNILNNLKNSNYDLIYNYNKIKDNNKKKHFKNNNRIDINNKSVYDNYNKPTYINKKNKNLSNQLSYSASNSLSYSNKNNELLLTNYNNNNNNNNNTTLRNKARFKTMRSQSIKKLLNKKNIYNKKTSSILNTNKYPSLKDVENIIETKKKLSTFINPSSFKNKSLFVNSLKKNSNINLSNINSITKENINKLLFNNKFIKNVNLNVLKNNGKKVNIYNYKNIFNIESNHNTTKAIKNNKNINKSNNKCCITSKVNYKISSINSMKKNLKSSKSHKNYNDNKLYYSIPYNPKLQTIKDHKESIINHNEYYNNSNLIDYVSDARIKKYIKNIIEMDKFADIERYNKDYKEATAILTAKEAILDNNFIKSLDLDTCFKSRHFLGQKFGVNISNKDFFNGLYYNEEDKKNIYTNNISIDDKKIIQNNRINNNNNNNNNTNNKLKINDYLKDKDDNDNESIFDKNESTFNIYQKKYVQSVNKLNKCYLKTKKEYNNYISNYIDIIK